MGRSGVGMVAYDCGSGMWREHVETCMHDAIGAPVNIERVDAKFATIGCVHEDHARVEVHVPRELLPFEDVEHLPIAR